MKKLNKTIALALALIMCLALVPAAALAADNLVLTVDKTDFSPGELFYTTVSGITVNDGVCVALCPADEPYHNRIEDYDGNGKNGHDYLWHRGTGTATRVFNAPDTAGTYELRLFSNGNTKPPVFVSKLTISVGGGATPVTPAPTPSGSTPWSNASSWAVAELEKAQTLGLIPATLNGQDFTKPITRAEFAAVSVKLYENLSGKTATASAYNPFKDTSDPELLKAYNVGITSGTSATEFSPNALITREQAATMLTRVFKKTSMPGWTIGTDGQFALSYTKPAAFADDKDISDWAKDSVYFMAANGIIAGTGNNNFSPKAVTDAQKAQGYAQATREQALVIAVRMVENLR